MYPVLEDLSITKTAVRDDDEACVAMVLDELAHDPEDPHSAIYTVTKDLAEQLGFYQLAVTGICYVPGVERKIVAVTQYGEVIIYDGDDEFEETIEADRGPIREVAVVGNAIVACGASLQVFRRVGDDNWAEFGPGDDMRAEFPRNHLEAMAGFAESEMYAAGRNGVIWWYDGNEWTPVQCATNLAFLSICCGADGVVYVGGQAGIVATGRRDAFVVHAPVDAFNDIWGVHEFQGKVYCAMMRALLTWDANTGLQTVPEAMALSETFYNLGAGLGVLWSLGEKDIIRFDGTAWTRIDEVEVE